MRPKYTIEEKQVFLEHVEKMADHMLRILEIDNGNIINEVGLDGYPFNESFDEIHSRMYAWLGEIEKNMTTKTKKEKPNKQTTRGFNIPKKFQKYKDWILDLDMSGAIMFVNPNSEHSVYCTPDWDGRPGIIAIQVTSGDIDETAEVPYTGKFDPSFWFESVKPFLDKYGKTA